MTADHVAIEEGQTVWSEVQADKCVLLELPGRWYLGVVGGRTALTAWLEPPALCIHSTGDHGLFLDGKGSAASGMEATPLPRGVEISLAHLESATPFDVEAFRRICKRTHSPRDDPG